MVVHLMATSINKLERLNVIVLHIPAGCTSKAQVRCVVSSESIHSNPYLQQPCDVGINRPFKDRLFDLQTMWSMEHPQGAIGRNEITHFMIDAWSTISAASIIITWRHIGFMLLETAHELKSDGSDTDDSVPDADYTAEFDATETGDLLDEDGDVDNEVLYEDEDDEEGQGEEDR
ncbi:hypothetical protein HDU99_002532 [Rhizoclosmatium hyalinum]|nr:hypothetical protein HDU99_002532 [Rhizoclosmatium hyalinum]